MCMYGYAFLYIVYFVLHTLPGFDISNSLNSFLNNFFVIYPIATKILEII